MTDTDPIHTPSQTPSFYRASSLPPAQLSRTPREPTSISPPFNQIVKTSQERRASTENALQPSSIGSRQRRVSGSEQQEPVFSSPSVGQTSSSRQRRTSGEQSVSLLNSSPQTSVGPRQRRVSGGDHHICESFTSASQQQSSSSRRRHLSGGDEGVSAASSSSSASTVLSSAASVRYPQSSEVAATGRRGGRGVSPASLPVFDASHSAFSTLMQTDDVSSIAEQIANQADLIYQKW